MGNNRIRRLSTMSTVRCEEDWWLKAFCVEWKWYWKDEFDNWIEYAQKVRQVLSSSTRLASKFQWVGDFFCVFVFCFVFCFVLFCFGFFFGGGLGERGKILEGYQFWSLCTAQMPFFLISFMIIFEGKLGVCKNVLGRRSRGTNALFPQVKNVVAFPGLESSIFCSNHLNPGI